MILEFSGDVQLPNQEEKEVNDLALHESHPTIIMCSCSLSLRELRVQARGGDNKLYVTGIICKDNYNKLDLTPNQHFNSNKMY